MRQDFLFFISKNQKIRNAVRQFKKQYETETKKWACRDLQHAQNMGLY